jgi:hypothetical protein
MLALERLSFDEKKGQVDYRWGRNTHDQETMDYLEFILLSLSLTSLHVINYPSPRGGEAKSSHRYTLSH